MKVAFNWTKPNGQRLEKAERFFWNKHPFSAMVGGIRNAKSTSAVRRTIFLALAFPGNRQLIARYRNTDLEKTTLLIFKEEIKRINDGRWGPGPVISKVKEAENYVELVNGSCVYWAHLDKPEDVQGSEWGSVHIDELHECKEDTFNQLKARMTYWNPQRVGEFLASKERMRMQREFLGVNVRPTAYFYITQNPHPNWTKKRIKENVDGEFFVIESSTMDNIENLPPEWWDSVKNMPDDWKKRFLDGSWDIAGGQVYKEFSTNIHVIDEFPIPDWWERLRGLDFGLRNPTAVSWFASDEYGNLFIYDEHYETGMLPEAHAKVIKAKSLKLDQPDPSRPAYFNSYEHSGKTYLKIIADPSGRSQSIVSGDKLFDEYMEYGISCEPGNNDFAFGYMRVSQYLHLDPDHVHPITGEKGSPRLFIFRKCANTIKEFIGYEWEAVGDTEERDPSERPKKHADHLMDEIRYVMATRPEPSRIVTKQEPMGRHVAMAQNAFTSEEKDDVETWN